MIAWGPGGDRLLLLHYGNLHLIDTTTGEVRQLTSGGNATAVLWQW
jgi:hypothetical protein